MGTIRSRFLLFGAGADRAGAMAAMLQGLQLTSEVIHAGNFDGTASD